MAVATILVQLILMLFTIIFITLLRFSLFCLSVVSVLVFFLCLFVFHTFCVEVCCVNVLQHFFDYICSAASLFNMAQQDKTTNDLSGNFSGPIRMNSATGDDGHNSYTGNAMRDMRGRQHSVNRYPPPHHSS